MKRFNKFQFNLQTKRVREVIQVALKVRDEKVDMLRFTDNMAVLVESEEDLQNILTTMNIILEDGCSMKMNKTKTIVLMRSRNEKT